MSDRSPLRVLGSLLPVHLLLTAYCFELLLNCFVMSPSFVVLFLSLYRLPDAHLVLLLVQVLIAQVFLLPSIIAEFLWLGLLVLFAKFA